MWIIFIKWIYSKGKWKKRSRRNLLALVETWSWWWAGMEAILDFLVVLEETCLGWVLGLGQTQKPTPTTASRWQYFSMWTNSVTASTSDFWKKTIIFKNSSTGPVSTLRFNVRVPSSRWLLAGSEERDSTKIHRFLITKTRYLPVDLC